MTVQIACVKLKKNADQMKSPPFPGPLGEKIHQSISQTAWQMWLAHQTMLINEYRLNLSDPKAREFLQQEMQSYLFGEGSNLPSGFKPPEESL
jgi:Fe-S cluster biosynthesis and repair protein YggX